MVHVVMKVLGEVRCGGTMTGHMYLCAESWPELYFTAANSIEKNVGE